MSSEKMLVTERGKQMHTEIAREYATFRPFCDREIALRRAGKGKEAVETMLKPEVGEARSVLRKSVADFEDYQAMLKDEVLKKQAATESSARTLLIGLALAGWCSGW